MVVDISVNVDVCVYLQRERKNLQMKVYSPAHTSEMHTEKNRERKTKMQPRAQENNGQRSSFHRINI